MLDLYRLHGTERWRVVVDPREPEVTLASARVVGLAGRHTAPEGADPSVSYTDLLLL